MDAVYRVREIRLLQTCTMRVGLRRLPSRQARPCLRRPRLIAEVLSLSTATYDRTTKLRVFERAGVPEVRLIDPTDRTVTIYRIADGQYGAPVVLELKGQTTLTAVPGVTIDWDDLLAT